MQARSRSKESSKVRIEKRTLYILSRFSGLSLCFGIEWALNFHHFW